MENAAKGGGRYCKRRKGKESEALGKTVKLTKIVTHRL
jgi:hypothetical protein